MDLGDILQYFDWKIDMKPKPSPTRLCSERGGKAGHVADLFYWNRMIQMKFNFRSYLAITEIVYAVLVTTVVTKSKLSVDPVPALL